ncbi:hypothetical protein JCM6882_004899 [Rhodosporidiobolus microsporus]
MLERFQCGANGQGRTLDTAVVLRCYELKSVVSLDHTSKRRFDNAGKLNLIASFPPFPPLDWLADAAGDVPSTVYTRHWFKSCFCLSSAPNPQSEAVSVVSSFLMSYCQTESRRHALCSPLKTGSDASITLLHVGSTVYTPNSVFNFVGVLGCGYNPVDVVKAVVAGYCQIPRFARLSPLKSRMNDFIILFSIACTLYTPDSLAKPSCPFNLPGASQAPP